LEVIIGSATGTAGALIEGDARDGGFTIRGLEGGATLLFAELLDFVFVVGPFIHFLASVFVYHNNQAGKGEGTYQRQ